MVKEKHMAELVIIRGVPGSGKTTMAKNSYSDHFLVEADMLFTNSSGEYTFDPSKIKQAHTWCQSLVRASLAAGKDTVVANTFIKKWELAPYLRMHQAPVIVVAQGGYTSVHGVPDEVVARMKKNFENL